MKHLSFYCLLLILTTPTWAQKNDETIALIKNNLSQSKEKIKQYEWLETTTTFVKGDQKSKSQNRCYYDVTGKLMKVATGETEAGKKPGGLRGKIAENKKDEMNDYIQKSIAKVQSYLPPDPAKIQQIYASGKAVIHVLEPDKRFKVDFNDYQQPGDMISIGIDKSKKMLTDIGVNTYLDKPDDKVNFDIRYGALPDGSQYPSETTLEANAKDLKIVIQNAGYKKTSG